MLWSWCLNEVATANIALVQKGNEKIGLITWSRCRGSDVACSALKTTGSEEQLIDLARNPIVTPALGFF